MLIKYDAKKKSNARKTKENRLMLFSNCAVSGKKKSTFIKNIELHNFNNLFQMNKIINKFLLTRDKFMPELHLKQAGFTYGAVDHLLNIVKELKNLEKQII